MILEAAWLKNGREIALVYPVWEIENLDDGSTLGTIKVHNGHCWYRWSDITNEEPDDFVVRVRKQRYTGKYIDVDSLWKCETCFYHRNGKCSTWCDYGESYRPAYSKLTIIEGEIIASDSKENT